MIIILGGVMLVGLFFSYTDIVRFKKTYMLVLLFSLATLGMLYDPVKAYLINGDYTDLYRMFSEIDNFRLFGWNADISTPTAMTTNYNAILVGKMYMYFIALISNNDHLLSFINAILTYSAAAIGINIVGMKFDLSNTKIVSTFVFFVLINDYSRVIANIRMPLAIAVFMLIFSFEIKDDKKKLWEYFAYIALCLLHNAMFLYLGIKLLVDIIPRSFRKFLILIMTASSIMVTPILSILMRFGGASSIVEGLVQKIQLYTGSNKVGFSLLSANVRMTLINMVRLCFFIFLIILCKRIGGNSSQSRSIDRFICFGEMLVALALGSLWSIDLFNRTVLFMLAIIPFYMIIISSERNVRVLPLKKMDGYTVISWLFLILNLLYYFGSYVYQQLVF
ncbi:hypothetical protein ACLOEZ_00360 [Levilactobacillus brevis]|uniref:hypothetical protein n=1 Tax=Levilactobacillus brevis TaxID=1580 RepID=UPI003EBE0270